MKIIKAPIYISSIILFLILGACKKGEGAICNDGTRSYSTGQGTCSWHGGVDHYVDPNEIDLLPTILLCAIIAFAIWFWYNFLIADKRQKDNSQFDRNGNKPINLIQIIEEKRIEQKVEQDRKQAEQKKFFKEIKNLAPIYQIELKFEHGNYTAKLKSQIYNEELKNLISRLEINRVWLNPLEGSTINLLQCLRLFPFATKLSIGKYFGRNDDQFVIEEVLFLPMIEDLTISGLSNKKFNLLIKGAKNLRQINFWDSNLREFEIDQLNKLSHVSVSDSIGIPILKNLPILESMIIREGRYRKSDFENIQIYTLKQLIIYNVKKCNMPDNFNQFYNLELKLLN
jgi:hypothetical protein